MSKTKKYTLFSLVLLTVVLIGLRLALPWIVKSYVNRLLSSIPGYYGHVEDVGISLYRGAYQLEGLEFLKREGSEKEPLFAADEIEFSVDWRALLHLRIVSRIDLTHPQLQFVVRATAASSQTKVDSSWQDKVKKLTVFDINSLSVENGLVRYKDETRDPKINFYFSRLKLDAKNISNVQASSELPSTFEAESLFLNTGHFALRGRANFLSDPIVADVKLAIRDLDLTEINNFTKSYGYFTFNRGKFAVTSEIAASKTRYSGYVKTLAKDIDVLDLSKELKKGSSVGHIIWEGLVGLIIEIFKNHKHDQFAARIPIEGERKKIEIAKWQTLASILRNAFVEALSPKFEDSVKYKDAVGELPNEDERPKAVKKASGD